MRAQGMAGVVSEVPRDALSAMVTWARPVTYADRLHAPVYFTARDPSRYNLASCSKISNSTKCYVLYK